MSKLIANDILAIATNYQEKQCSYDKALQDISQIIKKYCAERPIVGHVTSGTLTKVLKQIISSKIKNVEKSYIYDCQIHQNEMADIDRMITAIYTKSEIDSRKELTFGEYKAYIKGMLFGSGMTIDEIYPLMDQEYFIKQCFNNNLTVEYTVNHLKI